MTQFKKAQLVMLPTEKSTGNIAKTYNNIIYSINTHNRGISDHIDQHLHIISDDEIKEGDYFLADNRISKSSNKGIPNWIVCKCTKVKNTWIYCDEIPDEGHNGDWCKKIIATTNTSLKYQYSENHPFDLICLPQPSQQFIEKYIEEYNKGEVIIDILVEYEYIKTPDQIFYTNDVPYGYDNLKVNPKDNTINIKLLKESWNREEVKALLKNAFKVERKSLSRQEDWIEENL